MNDSFYLLAIISTTVFLLLAVFIVSFSLLFQRRQQENLREKVALRVAYEEEILKSQLEIQNQTLKQVGEELHDNIEQLLAITKLYLNSLEDLTLNSEARDLVLNANNVVDKTIDDIRALTKGLDSTFVEEFGLVATLSHNLERIRKARRVAVQLSITGSAFSLGPQKEVVLYRIVQEILTNALKHSGAKQILIAIDYQSSNVALSVRDDGVGFDYEAVLNNELSQSGAGLRNIERRVRLIGGNCLFKTAPGTGTIVDISLQT